MTRAPIGTVPLAVCAVLLLVTPPGIDGRQAEPSTPIPTFTLDAGWPKLPAKWRFGQVSDIAIDSRDHAWVLQRPRSLPPDQKSMAGPPVLEFDTAGNFLRGWGGAGKGYDWPQIEHALHIDRHDHVWLTGIYCPDRKLPGLEPVADDQLLKFTLDGRFLLQIGKSNQSRGNDDTDNLRQPAGVFLFAKTNEVFVADGYGNRRVIVYDADTGKFKRMWGAFGNHPVDSYGCPPDYEHNKSIDSEPGPPQFHIVHDVKISEDELVYVADRSSGRVQVFTPDGKFLKQVIIGTKLGGSAHSVAFSPPPAQEFLYVDTGSALVIIRRKTLTIAGSFPTGEAHHITTDSVGNLYTAQVGQGGLRSTGGSVRRFLVNRPGKAND